MNSRIRQFMNHKGITSSELADNIGVQRSNVTHVLNDRNKPSFQFIAKLLETYPEIDAKWLIMGQGHMLESTGNKVHSNLFSSVKPAESVESQTNQTIPDVEIKSKQPESPKGLEMPPDSFSKQIERIVVFYTDQTFKEYTPSK